MNKRLSTNITLAIMSLLIVIATPAFSDDTETALNKILAGEHRSDASKVLHLPLRGR